MNLRNNPVWLKGGIILLAFYWLCLVIYFIFIKKYTASSCGYFDCLLVFFFPFNFLTDWWNGWGINNTGLQLTWITSIIFHSIFYFGIGSLLGLIIKKIKTMIKR